MTTDQGIISYKVKNIYSLKSTTKEVSGQTVYLMPITPPHKGDPCSDVFVLLDTWGQRTIQICLGNTSTYVGFRHGLSYRTETSGISLRQQEYMNCNHSRVLKDG